MTMTTTGMATRSARASVRSARTPTHASAHDGARNGSRFGGGGGFASRGAREALTHERHDDAAQVEMRERREAKDERRVVRDIKFPFPLLYARVVTRQGSFVYTAKYTSQWKELEVVIV